MKSKPPGIQVADVRTQAERALAESQAKYFQGLMDQPDFGYQSEFEKETPLYERAKRDLKEGLSGYAAEKGFGALGHGPSVSAYGRSAQEMEENRAASEIQRRNAWRDYVQSGGRMAATPLGRTAFQTPGRPSAFSQLISPVLGGVGAMLGGGLGAGLGTGFGSLFGGGQQSYTGMSDTVRSRQSEDEGFRGGFGRGWRGFFGRGTS